MNPVEQGEQQAIAGQPKCEYCHKPSTYTAYREIGFGQTVIVAYVCTTHKKKLEGRN